MKKLKSFFVNELNLILKNVKKNNITSSIEANALKYMRPLKYFDNTTTVRVATGITNDHIHKHD